MAFLPVVVPAEVVVVMVTVEDVVLDVMATGEVDGGVGLGVVG